MHLWLNHHNIIIVVERHQQIDISISKWATKAKAQWSNILPSITKSVVGAWWVDQTKVSPNQTKMQLASLKEGVSTTCQTLFTRRPSMYIIVKTLLHIFVFIWLFVLVCKP
jgi:hypothetical protein